MDLMDAAAGLIALCALFSYLNHRLFRLPTTIGVMLIALAVSLALIMAGAILPGLPDTAARLIEGLHFDEALMNGMLGFLLFAGALHVDLNRLSQQASIVGTLATLGVVASTFLVGGASYVVFDAIGLPQRFIDCLVFGALISPTDPIAVLAILRQANAPPKLQTTIVGESMFNDGVGVVVFLIVAGIAATGAEASMPAIAELFAIEAAGGVAYGLLLGWLVSRMLARVTDYRVAVLLTLALVMGGYALARALHTSGPLAMVVAGLLIGNRGQRDSMPETTHTQLDIFWELVDEILNVVLFALIGFELLILPRASAALLTAAVLAIPLVLCARFTAVSVPLLMFRRLRSVTPHAAKVLTWGGLRGGISIALALSLPPSPARDVILVVTYAVVAFSITAQGLTIGPLVRRLYGLAEPSDDRVH